MRRLSIEEELVQQCVSFAPQPAHLVKLLGSATLDWDRVLLVAAQHSVLPFLEPALRGMHGLRVPDSVLQATQNSARLTAASNQRLDESVQILVEGFNREGVPFLVLKGAALLHTVYRTRSHLRGCQDIDILVRKSDLSRGHDVLTWLGYTREPRRQAGYAGGYLLGRYAAEADPGTSLHENPDLVHLTTIRKKDPSGAGGPLAVEVHFDLLKSHNNPFHFSVDEMWNRKRSVSINGLSMPIPGVEDMLLHGAMHMSFHKEFVFRPLRQLRDLGEIITGETVTWDELSRLTFGYSLERPVYYALTLGTDLLEVPVPQDFLALLRTRIGPSELRLFARLERDRDFVTYRDPARLFVQTALLQVPAYRRGRRLRFALAMIRHPFKYNDNPAKQFPRQYLTGRFEVQHVWLLARLLMIAVFLMLDLLLDSVRQRGRSLRSPQEAS